VLTAHGSQLTRSRRRQFEVSANFDLENDRRSSTRILFVDDEPLELEGLRRSVYKEFVADLAGGPEEGLAKLRSSGRYAVVVSDMRMPAMDWGEHRSARALLHWQLPMMPPFRTGPTEDGFPSLRPLRLCGASREPNSTQRSSRYSVSLTEIAQHG